MPVMNDKKRLRKYSRLKETTEIQQANTPDNQRGFFLCIKDTLGPPDRIWTKCKLDSHKNLILISWFWLFVVYVRQFSYFSEIPTKSIGIKVNDVCNLLSSSEKNALFKEREKDKANMIKS